MKTWILLAGLVIAAPTPALQMSGNTITLDEHELSQCEAGGGCVTVTREAIEEAMKQAVKRALLSYGRCA